MFLAFILAKYVVFEVRLEKVTIVVVIQFDRESEEPVKSEAVEMLARYWVYEGFKLLFQDMVTLDSPTPMNDGEAGRLAKVTVVTEADSADSSLPR